MTSLSGFAAFAFAGLPSFRIFKCHSTTCWIFQLAVVAIILMLGVRRAWRTANAHSDDTIPR